MIMTLEGTGAGGGAGTCTVVGGVTTGRGGAVVAAVVVGAVVVGTVVVGALVVGAGTALVDAILIGACAVEDAFVPVAPEQLVPATRTAMVVAASSHVRTGGLIFVIPPPSVPPNPSFPITVGKITFGNHKYLVGEGRSHRSSRR
jgi:hypothetical protein